MAKGILFDMDGLLVDTEPLLCRAVILALKLQGIGLAEEEYYSRWTRHGGNVWEFIESKNIRLDVQKYRKDKIEIYLGLLKEELEVMPGAREKVIEFSGAYKLALVSGSNRGIVEFITKAADLEKYFSTVVAFEDVKNGKPAPDSLLLAAQGLGIGAEDCVVIEDAEKGVLAAKNAGMKVIAVPNKYTKDNDFSKADVVLDNLHKLSREIVESI